MKKISRALMALIVLTSLAVVLGGCAATYTGLRYKDLKVESKMSATIFLDPVAPAQRTVFIQVHNTSDKPFNIQNEVAAAVASKGYRIVQDPTKAHYLLQANVLSVGLTDESALEKASMAGFGGVAAGAAAGALLGGSRPGAGAAVGGLAAGAAELISGALVKVNTYAVITDVQISEATKTGVSQQFKSVLKQGTANTTTVQNTASSTNFKKYQTRIISTARQTNLQFQEAYPALKQGMVQAIAGVM